MTDRRRFHVAGLPIIDAGVNDAVAMILAAGAARTPRVFAFVNGYSATLRHSHPSYAALLETDRIVPLPDGASMTIGARLTGHASVQRAPGPDVFEAAASAAAATGVSFFLLGGMPGTVESLATALRIRHPALRLAGTHTPPVGVWTPGQTKTLVDAITASDADIVWLGVSAPLQETWANSNLDSISRPVVCVGAAFDFLSGNKPRAPRWMRSIGTEWLYRLITEPQRLWRRYLLGNLRFVLDLIRYRGHTPG